MIGCNFWRPPFYTHQVLIHWEMEDLEDQLAIFHIFEWQASAVKEDVLAMFLVV